jgi:hypothetical protein
MEGMNSIVGLLLFLQQSQTSRANYPALIISSLALLFTIFSFWWMNWRRGKLIVVEPRSYAARGSQSESLIITIPIVFYNNGAAAIVVQNLRLLLLDEGHDTTPLFFNATIDKLLSDEGRAFATQFPVRGREAVKLICEFQRSPGSLLFEARRYPIELQAMLNDKKVWKKLCSFHLRVTEAAANVLNQRYVAHDNFAE